MSRTFQFVPVAVSVYLRLRLQRLPSGAAMEDHLYGQGRQRASIVVIEDQVRLARNAANRTDRSTIYGDAQSVRRRQLLKVPPNVAKSQVLLGGTYGIAISAIIYCLSCVISVIVVCLKRWHFDRRTFD